MRISPAQRGRRTRLVVGGVVAITVLAPITWAFAGLFASSAITASATADTLSAVGAPVTQREGRNIRITWEAAGSGAAPTGYAVTRHESGGTETIVTCPGSLALECLDEQVPSGTHTYTVTATLHSWSSASSGASDAIQIDAPSATLTGNQRVRATGALAGISVLNFPGDVDVAFSASPGNVALGTLHTDAAGAISGGQLIVPAGTAEHASYTLIATGGGFSTNAANTFAVDNTAPLTTLNILTGTLGTNSWYTSDVTTSFATNEPGVTTYELNGAATLAYAPGSTFALSATSTFTYRSTDLAGNLEQPSKSTTVQIDKVAPTAGTLSATTPTKVVSASVPSALDATSGIRDITYTYCVFGAACPSPTLAGTASAAGQVIEFTPASDKYTITATVRDNAGLTSTATKDVIVDNVAPTVSITAPASGATVGGLTPVTFTASVNDGTAGRVAGVKRVAFEYGPTAGNGPWTALGDGLFAGGTAYSLAAQVNTLPNGQYALRVRGIDNLDNEGQALSTFTVANFKVTNLQLSNTSGAVPGGGSNANQGVGFIDTGDTIKVTYSTQLRPQSFCSTWTGAAPLTVTMNILDTPGGDTIQLASSVGGCAPSFQQLQLGSTAYVTGTVSITSTVSLDATGTVLTITVGSISNPVKNGMNGTASATTARYVPSPTLQSTALVLIDPTPFATTAVQF